MTLTLRLFLLLLLLSGTTHAQRPKLKPLKDILPPAQILPGLWSGETPGGGTEYMSFDKDGTLLIVGPGGQRENYSWKCEGTESTKKLDLIIKLPDGSKATIYTICDFPDMDTFRMAPPAIDEVKRPGPEALKNTKHIMRRIPLTHAGLAQAVEAHLKTLTGTWADRSGKLKNTVTFTKDGTYTLREGSEKLTGKFRIDVTKVPCAIDLVPDDFSGPKYAIYEYKDGILRLSEARKKAAERPVDFTNPTELMQKK